VGDGFALVPTPEQARRLAGVTGPVSLGIRPQHMRVAPASGGGTLDARVDVVEHLGSEKYAYFPLGGKTITARLGERDPVSEGGITPFAVDMQQVFLFDQTGRNLMLDKKEGNS
jgi:ABC-type sugar transport system ATPase subunit